ncbi:hypothetical protein [Gemella sp. zg-570]|uniref:hypothetical protein n=1 Tax=unclassified Gemella TaxID=2624949 RepID=UPI001C03AC3F|nr:hypothetical protein [Gemella sp. zg-1178]QWQ39396.1 hypothetical protein KMP11_03475 [Gemella sp. zg-570]
MKFRSLFDIIDSIMVSLSSSQTAGVARIGQELSPKFKETARRGLAIRKKEEEYRSLLFGNE